MKLILEVLLNHNRHQTMKHNTRLYKIVSGNYSKVFPVFKIIYTLYIYQQKITYREIDETLSCCSKLMNCGNVVKYIKMSKRWYEITRGSDDVIKT